MKLGTLRLRMPDGQSREFDVEQAAIGVGRASDNELVLDDISVSRRHARLTFDAGQMTVEDLGSANGSYIGGQRLAPNMPTPVPAGEAVRLGDVELRFEPAPAPPPRAPPAPAGDRPPWSSARRLARTPEQRHRPEPGPGSSALARCASRRRTARRASLGWTNPPSRSGARPITSWPSTRPPSRAATPASASNRAG